MGMATLRRMSNEEFLALPDDDLVHELIEGVHVVNPPPSDFHEAAFRELFVLLERIVAPRRDLALRASHSALHFGPDTIFSPDIFIYVRDPDNRRPKWADVPIPLLVVEILSPSGARRDRGIKRRYYQERGVEEYWIVDLHARTIERWRPGNERPQVVTDQLHFILTVGVEGTIDLKEYFARVDW